MANDILIGVAIRQATGAGIVLDQVVGRLVDCTAAIAPVLLAMLEI